MKLPFLSLVNKRLIEAADESIIFEKHGNNFWPSSSNIQFTRLLNLKKDISTKTKILNFPML